jgi:circadian clock protein KaiC
MNRISTGVPGLDQILRGGLLPGRVYLVHGQSGTGKTTLGLHFVSSGQEEGLLITFGQAADRIRADAAAIGLSVENVTILDFTPPAETFAEMQTYDIFSPSEVEREPMAARISKAIQEGKPKRIFVDSFGWFKSLASDAFQQRRLAQSFFRFATARNATLMIASDEQSCARDVDGIIHLESEDDGRTIRVEKFRGSDFQGGYHPMRLGSQGLHVPLSAA